MTMIPRVSASPSLGTPFSSYKGTARDIRCESRGGSSKGIDGQGTERAARNRASYPMPNRITQTVLPF